MQEQEHEHWQMPKWWYREGRPSNDNQYFENMCRVIFQAGLNWHVIDNKWVTIRKAFANFNVNRVSSFDNADKQRLLKDTGIVRNKSKVEAIIYNARGFKAIQQKYSSFQSYLDSLDKSNNYSKVIKDLTEKFKHIGPASASLFLYTVGEEIKLSS